MPGFEQQDIHADLKNGYLVIMAQRPQYVEDEFNKRVYTSRERHIGGCHRKYYVGDDIAQENIHAAYKNGILKVAIQLPEKRLMNQRKLIEFQ